MRLKAYETVDKAPKKVISTSGMAGAWLSYTDNYPAETLSGK